MKALLLSLDVHDGGASRCVRELLERLPSVGVEAEAWVARHGPAPHPKARCFRRPWERWLDLLEALPGWFDRRHRGSIAALDALGPGDFDVVHLHNIHNGCASIQAVHDLCLRLPAVWTLHDEWAAGGLICDLTGLLPRDEAKRLRGGLLGRLWYSPYHDHFRSRDARRLLDRWPPRPRVVVTPSAYIADVARRSGRFPGSEIQVIRNAVTLTGLPEAEAPRAAARQALGLAEGVQAVLMVAPHLRLPHKGTSYGAEALNRLEGPLQVVLAGGGGEGLVPLIRHHVIALGPRGDADLALAYRAADVTLVPSLAESFSLVAAESMACGTPVAGFSVGGLAELVGLSGGGLLARPFDRVELAAQLRRLLGDERLRPEMGASGRRWAEEHLGMSRHLRALVGAYERAREMHAADTDGGRRLWPG